MPTRVCAISIPALGHDLLAHIPASSALGQYFHQHPPVGLTPSWPALTCSVQATLTTGQAPSRHGIIANGLPTFRFPADQALVDASNFAAYRKQISFWEQSNQFLNCPRFWQNPDGSSKYKTALLFFQHSMPGFVAPQRQAADIVLTPKPEHGPGGKIVSLLWANPSELVGQLFAELGPFPLQHYWGPMAGLPASQWIASAAASVWTHHNPRLQLVYVPHLDYDLQRFGPSSPQAAAAVVALAGALEPLINTVLADENARLVIFSEYAMHDVNRAIAPNRLLAGARLLKTRSTEDGALIDYETSDALAMVDHQIAHIYCNSVKSIQSAIDCLSAAGLTVHTREELAGMGLDHPRSGDLLAIAPDDAWLDYRWWTDPAAAPSFARMVDIHRKPGYDPMELFWDRPANGTSQDPLLVRGSHGIVHKNEAILSAPASSLPTGDLTASHLPTIINHLMQ